jgi:hypothetical protein
MSVISLQGGLMLCPASNLQDKVLFEASYYWLLAAGRPGDKQPVTSDKGPAASGQRPEACRKLN